jgi:hypothetical protein
MNATDAVEHFSELFAQMVRPLTIQRLREIGQVGDQRLKLGVFLISLAVPACGPLLDYRDAVEGRVGPNTPTGSWKRDFWGRSYFETYPWLYTVPSNVDSFPLRQP